MSIWPNCSWSVGTGIPRNLARRCGCVNGANRDRLRTSKSRSAFAPASWFGLGGLRLVQSDDHFFVTSRWALGELQFLRQVLLLSGGGNDHAFRGRAAPDFCQEVGVADAVEHQFGGRAAWLLAACLRPGGR